MAIYMWREYVHRTFTISWTEKSDMSSGWTYSDDAAWLTAGSTAFDEFFGYSAVRLSPAWVETKEVKQTTPWQLDFSKLWTLTSGDNVMIKFPRMWIKMTKNGSTVTLSITDDPDATADGFQYYAHSRWTFSGNKGTVDKDAFYLWAFKATNSSNVLKSWSNATPVVSITQANSITYARANDGNSWSAWYDIIWFYQREFVNALYLMKYWSADSQTKVWLWYTGASAKVNTWGTVSQLSATYWTTSNTQQVKLFWLEDWWGNVYEWIGWMCTDGSKNLWTALSGFTGNITTSSPYENTGTTIQHSWSYYCLSSIVWSNKWMFAPTATVNNWSYNTYYCDYAYVSASRLALAGGNWSNGSYAGAFFLDVFLSASDTNTYVGARLMFL